MSPRGLCLCQNISIHAPVKGATLCFLTLCQVLWDFNPRSREGSDYGIWVNSQPIGVFQSTLP